MQFNSEHGHPPRAEKITPKFIGLTGGHHAKEEVPTCSISLSLVHLGRVKACRSRGCVALCSFSHSLGI